MKKTAERSGVEDTESGVSFAVKNVMNTRTIQHQMHTLAKGEKQQITVQLVVSICARIAMSVSTRSVIQHRLPALLSTTDQIVLAQDHAASHQVLSSVALQG